MTPVVVPDSGGARRPTPPRAARSRATTAARRSPTLRHERALLGNGARLVAGMDEVGRGALAGPVSVGVVVVDAATRTAPQGLTDSKLLTAAARESLVPQVRRWGVAWAVGHAGPAEIDAHGIVAALRLAGRRAKPKLVAQVIEQVGLGERRRHLPAELSGGQQQRVAIARALVTRPAVLFADEPTGALDTRTARDVLGLLRRSVQEAGQTVVMVTHDPVAAAYADRVVFLADGRLVGELVAPTAEAVAEQMTHLGAWAERSTSGAR